MFWFYWVIAFVSPGELSARLPPSTYPPLHPPTVLYPSVLHPTTVLICSLPTYCTLTICTTLHSPTVSICTSPTYLYFTHLSVLHSTPPTHCTSVTHCTHLYFIHLSVHFTLRPPTVLYCASPSHLYPSVHWISPTVLYPQFSTHPLYLTLFYPPTVPICTSHAVMLCILHPPTVHNPLLNSPSTNCSVMQCTVPVHCTMCFFSDMICTLIWSFPNHYCTAYLAPCPIVSSWTLNNRIIASIGIDAAICNNNTQNTTRRE